MRDSHRKMHMDVTTREEDAPVQICVTEDGRRFVLQRIHDRRPHKGAVCRGECCKLVESRLRTQMLA